MFGLGAGEEVRECFARAKQVIIDIQLFEKLSTDSYGSTESTVDV